MRSYYHDSYELSIRKRYGNCRTLDVIKRIYYILDLTISNLKNLGFSRQNYSVSKVKVKLKLAVEAYMVVRC
jgi:hypothetical protein